MSAGNKKILNLLINVYRVLYDILHLLAILADKICPVYGGQDFSVTTVQLVDSQLKGNRAVCLCASSLRSPAL